MKFVHAGLLFIALHGLAPGAVCATEPARVARVGFLGASHGLDEPLAQSFVAGMRDLGYVEGRNVTYVQRTARGDLSRLPLLAKELVEEKVDVIVAPPSVAALAVIRATTKVPVVFLMATDPVALGIVKSLSRPGGNATGIANPAEILGAKMIEILVEALPAAPRQVAILMNATNPAHDRIWQPAQAYARSIGIEALRVDVRGYEEIAPALEHIGRLRPDGLVVIADPLFISRREAIVEHVSGLRLPAIYGFGEFADAGGLMTYGVDLAATFRRGASIVDRVLRGADPAGLPVEQAPRLVLTLNLKAAERIGYAPPRRFLLRVDRTIP